MSPMENNGAMKKIENNGNIKTKEKVQYISSKS